MKNILAPTDFSSSSENAVNLALKIAQKAGAEIHFLHGIVTPIDWERLKLLREDRYPELKHQIGHARGELEAERVHENDCTQCYREFGESF